MFASPAHLELIWLPHSVSELCVVGPHYHVCPLLDYETDGSFVVLALRPADCRVLRGDRWTLEPVTIPDLPQGNPDWLAIDPQPMLAAYTAATAKAEMPIIWL